MNDLRMLFSFNRWANLRFLDALAGQSDEELGRNLRSSFPSVAATLVHLVGAEWVWLRRWQGESPTSLPDAATLNSVAAVRALWDALWDEQRAYLETLDDAALSRTIAYRGFDAAAFEAPLGELVRHVVNHATYHRGQLATMLRQLGHTPPPTDFVRYCRERRGGLA